ncbi:MAG: hypothetical protein O7G87_01770 [bacterium]|nr:hypothetical protein [bacterium]
MFRPVDVDLNLTDGLLLGLLIPLCLFGVYRVYRAGRGGRIRGWLMGLRGLTFLLLLVLMMEPILALTVQTRRLPLVAVLVDESESMQVEARKDTALALLQNPVFERLAQKARVRWFGFSDRVREFYALDTLGFDGRATDLAGALDALREETLGEGLVSVVLISDGGQNLGGRPERAAEELGAPVLVVGVGNPVPPRDVAVVSAVMDPLGYVGRELALEVGVRVSGYPEGQALVEVMEGDRRVGVQPIVLREGEQGVVFTLVPDRAGRHAYRVAIAPQGGEQSVENNTVVVSTEILESRVRVLMVGGSPDADLAYLRRILEADSNLDLEVAVVDRSGDGTVRALLGRSEERELVILVDLPHAVLAGQPEQALTRFVEGGGSLLVIGGEQALNRGYASSPLARALPLICLQSLHTLHTEAFVLQVMGGSARHPIMRLTDDPFADQAAWEVLPPLLAYQINGGPRPGATVLAWHPTKRVGGKPMPLVAVMRPGVGKSMVVGLRTFWRYGLMMWGIGKTDVVAQTFWSQSVRWLVSREDVSRVRVVVDKPVYRSGEPVMFHAQVFDALLEPREGATVKVSVSEGTGVREAILKDRGGGRYAGQMGGFTQGDYAFEVDAEVGDQSLGRGKGHFTIGQYSLEYEDVRMNRALLTGVAERSGGAFVRVAASVDSLDALVLAPQPVTMHYKSRLWGQTWPFVVLLFCLGVEWTVRRRRGMV